MTRFATLIIAAVLCCAATATPPPVTVISPCERLDAHGKGRWAVKTDSSLPPADASTLYDSRRFVIESLRALKRLLPTCSVFTETERHERVVHTIYRPENRPQLYGNRQVSRHCSRSRPR